MIQFKKWNCDVVKREYENGRLALQLVSADILRTPIAMATANLPDIDLGEGEVFVKDYSENAGMLDALVAAKIVEPTGRTVRTGFVEVHVARVLI